MAVRTVTFSLDEEIIKKIEVMTKNRVEIASKSHLITIAILKEYARFKKMEDKK